MSSSYILLIFELLFIIPKCSSFKLDLHKITRYENFYEIATFISDNFTNSSGLQPSRDFPNKIYSFHANDNHSSENGLENRYSLQESLIILHTINLMEIEPFIDFLIPQLTVKKRPKCLVVYSGKYEQNKDVIDAILKYAWEKKFLDFTIIMMDNDTPQKIYFLNPFHDVVHEEEFDEGTNIFPDKLENANGYPFYIQNDLSAEIFEVRRTNQKVKVNYDDMLSVEFVAKHLNLKIVQINKTDPDNLEKRNLDMIPFASVLNGMAEHYIIPTHKKTEMLVALVPIIRMYQINPYLRQKYVIIMSILILIIACFSNRLKIRIKHIEVGDWGQLFVLKLQKVLHKIIQLTFIIGTVGILNYYVFEMIIFLRPIYSEVPFETYEDLYYSQLQTYAPETILHTLRKIKFNFNPELMKVIDRTLPMDDPYDCVSMLIQWKNVSCLMLERAVDFIPTVPDHWEPTVKVAKPPILPELDLYLRFDDGSPYAEKFLEIMQRVWEGKLMHRPALLHPNRMVMTTGEKYEDLGYYGGSFLERYGLIVFVGLTMSGITFVLEVILFVIQKMFKKKGTRR